jgi:hypothetical protein
MLGVGVSIDETRRHAAAVQLDHARPRADEPAELRG